MAGKGTDRKSKAKDVKSPGTADSEINESAIATFTLPDSLSCSEVDFPILIKRRACANWKDIIEESDKWNQELNEYVEAKAPTLKPPFQKTECDYIRDEILVYLVPALVETLEKAQIWEALVQQKCFFNGIDHIAQVLWNNNPRYPGRKAANLHLFNMPWVINQLKIRLMCVQEFLMQRMYRVRKWHYGQLLTYDPLEPARDLESTFARKTVLQQNVSAIKKYYCVTK